LLNFTHTTQQNTHAHAHTHTSYPILIHTELLVSYSCSCSFSLIVNLARLNWLSRLICIVLDKPINSPYLYIFSSCCSRFSGKKGGLLFKFNRWPCNTPNRAVYCPPENFLPLRHPIADDDWDSDDPWDIDTMN